MKQYCRYCSHAVEYYGFGEWFICTASAPCGLNGAGKEYPANKARRPNSCPHFKFCEYDLFGMDENGNYRTYKPMQNRTYKPMQKQNVPNHQQIEMELPE